MLGRLSSLITRGFFAAALRPTVATGLVAAGTTRAAALQLSADVNVVSTAVAGASDGVRLPKVEVGDQILVRNDDDGTINVYPVSAGEQINSVTAGDALAVATGKTVLFVGVTPTRWLALVTA